MAKEVFVFEVNQKSFDQYVLLNSHKIPVIVEFMGVWSGPCVAMELLFSGLAKEFAEQFIFAKVDIDEQQELRKEHKIENVPTIMVFKDGKLVRTETGELKDAEARQLLKDFGVFHQSDLMREQAREKHLAGDTHAAIIQLTEAIQADPSNTRVAMDMVQIFMDMGELDQANGLLNRLPAACLESDIGKALKGQLALATFAEKLDSIETLQAKLDKKANDLDARFDLSIRQISQYQNNEAMDNLFYIITENADYKDGAAKEMIITVTNTIAQVDNDQAQTLRRKLANLLAG